MFGIVSSLARAAVGTVLLPVDVVTDVVTLGGSLTDREEPYTAKRLSQIGDALDDAVNE